VCERLIADESFSYLKVNHFGVIEDLSVVAGSPGVHDSARAHPGLVQARFEGLCHTYL
jgi:hypothetical protein